ncbi:MAG TPA: HAMP domain-containing sensor histidine kinase [Chitinophagaceae bacterium]|jgi:signal transduction histidine kinase|nr:HAMP domain-containing sensor histidine kinase [Chitinophagaceae bacterium]
MKLQSQYNRVTIISTLIILLIAAAGYYFLLRYVLVRQLDEALKVEEAEIHDYVNTHDQLPAATIYKDQRISFTAALEPVKRKFESREVFDTAKNEKESARQLLFPLTVNGQYYTASVIISEEATEDLAWIILFTTVALIVLLTVLLFFIHRFLLKKLWQPFRNTLSSIKEFNLSAPVEISMQSTHITEFRELNDSIRMMAQKVMKDYQSLKDFTDHASHEMQTPLAVIHSKLDVLIQEPELSGKSLAQIQGVYKAVEKLSRLCQSLLLLARIENNQYTSTQKVFINQLVEERNREMEEWAGAMNVTIRMELDPLPVIMNNELAGMIVSNLFRNAVKHNQENGSIIIRTRDHQLIVSNTGKTMLDKRRIFDRFYKSDQSDGSGLGLAIVQHICEHYHYKLDYQFNEDGHSFILSFLQNQPER